MSGDSNKAGTVLVVDDEVEIREIIELSATSLGMKVLGAPDGQAALEILRAEHVDVVVSDLMMPRMTGITLLNSMRSEGLAQPFIFVTAFPSQDSTLQALRLGAFDYIEKPFDPDELETTLREAMRVSTEVQRLDPTTTEAAADADRATSEIQKLRTLRFSDGPGAGGDAATNQRLAEMFVAETTPQLLFCEAAIKGLESPEQRAFELGYLFRVAQAISSAAEAIGAHQVRDLATAAVRLYTVLRVKPGSVTMDVLDLAQRSNEALRLLVSGSSEADATVRDEASAAQRDLNEMAKAIEEGRRFKAAS